MAHIDRERFVLHSWTKDGRAVSRPSRDGGFGSDLHRPLRQLNDYVTYLTLLGIAGFALGYATLLIFRQA